MTKQHNDDCKRLLRLMGVPVVEVFMLRRPQSLKLNQFWQKMLKERLVLFFTYRPLPKQKRSVLHFAKWERSVFFFLFAFQVFDWQFRVTSVFILAWVEFLHGISAAMFPYDMLLSVQVYGVASEDMDSLTFGAPKFLRHLMDPSSRKIPVMEFDVAKVSLSLSHTHYPFFYV